jgi:hypothetical protein
MRAFMLSGVHHGIMARLHEWCDEAALVHWVQDANEPPVWTEAHRRLQKEGRDRGSIDRRMPNAVRVPGRGRVIRQPVALIAYCHFSQGGASYQTH